jgi:hypothetical protein
MRTLAGGIRTFMSSAFCSRSLRNTRTVLSPEVPSIMPFALGISEVSENTAPAGTSVSRDPFSALSTPRTALLIRYAFLDSVNVPHPSVEEDACRGKMCLHLITASNTHPILTRPGPFSIQVPVQIVSSADQRQVRQRLREISQRLSTMPLLFRV